MDRILISQSANPLRDECSSFIPAISDMLQIHCSCQPFSKHALRFRRIKAAPFKLDLKMILYSHLVLMLRFPLIVSTVISFQYKLCDQFLHLSFVNLKDTCVHHFV